MKLLKYWYIYAGLLVFVYMVNLFENGKGFEIFLIISIVAIVSNIITKIKLDRKYKIKINNVKEYEYWNEAEFKYIEPIHAGLILNKTPIDINGIIATIFLLEEKGIFSIEISGDKYYIKLNKIGDIDIEKLKIYEQQIVKFFFSSINDDKKIDLTKEINNIKSDYSKRIIINDICKQEQKNVFKKFYKGVFEELSKTQTIVYALLSINCIFGYLIIFAGFIHMSNLVIPMIVVYTIQVCQQLYYISSKQLYIKYLSEATKLQGLYNFLTQYSTIKDKDIKYVKLYEK